MCQRPALSTVTAEEAEALADEWTARVADGICADDIAYLTPRIHLVVVRAQEADLAQAAGLAVIRGGKSAQRARGLLREVETFPGRSPEAA